MKSRLSILTVLVAACLSLVLFGCGKSDGNQGVAAPFF
jgi:hypothetical protein